LLSYSTLNYDARSTAHQIKVQFTSGKSKNQQLSRIVKAIHETPKSNFHNCSLDARCGTEGHQVNGYLFDKQQSCLYLENEVPPTSPLATQLQQYSHLQFIWKTSFLYLTLRKILIGVILKSNRKLLPLPKTTQSKFKQKDKFLQSILLSYFYIDLCNMKGKN